MSNASRLRRRQAERAPRVSARLRESTQPPALTVEVVRELVANAQSLRFIELDVPRSREPRGKRVTLLSRSGPLSIKPDDEEERRLKWDGKRRAATASWRVEDLRAWVESIGGAEVAADMEHTPITRKFSADQIRESLAHDSGCDPDCVRLIVTEVADGPSIITAEADTDLEALNKAKRKRVRKSKGSE